MLQRGLQLRHTHSLQDLIPTLASQCIALNAACQVWFKSCRKCVVLLYVHCVSLCVHCVCITVEMLEYMLAQSGPSSRELSSKAEYSSFVTASSARAVAFISDNNSELLEAYIEAGQLIREDLKLAHCYDLSYDDAVAEVNSIIVYHPPHLVSPYEHAYTIITNASQFDEDEKSLADQILKATRPLVGELSIQNSRRVYRLRPLLIAFYQVDWKEGLTGE